jgi:hypothetical protein
MGQSHSHSHSGRFGGRAHVGYGEAGFREEILSVSPFAYCIEKESHGELPDYTGPSEKLTSLEPDASGMAFLTSLGDAAGDFF